MSITMVQYRTVGSSPARQLFLSYQNHSWPSQCRPRPLGYSPISRSTSTPNVYSNNLINLIYYRAKIFDIRQIFHPHMISFQSSHSQITNLMNKFAISLITFDANVPSQTQNEKVSKPLRIIKQNFPNFS